MFYQITTFFSLTGQHALPNSSTLLHMPIIIYFLGTWWYRYFHQNNVHELFLIIEAFLQISEALFYLRLFLFVASRYWKTHWHIFFFSPLSYWKRKSSQWVCSWNFACVYTNYAIKCHAINFLLNLFVSFNIFKFYVHFYWFK